MCFCVIFQTWYEQAATTQQVKAPPAPTVGENMTDYQLRLSALCKRGKAKGKRQEAAVFVPPDIKLNQRQEEAFF